jgi:hypothetical protein
MLIRRRNCLLSTPLSYGIPSDHCESLRKSTLPETRVLRKWPPADSAPEAIGRSHSARGSALSPVFQMNVWDSEVPKANMRDDAGHLRLPRMLTKRGLGLSTKASRRILVSRAWRSGTQRA